MAINAHLQEHRNLQRATSTLGDLFAKTVSAMAKLEPYFLRETALGTWTCQICQAEGHPEGITHKKTCQFAVLDTAQGLRDDLERKPTKRGLDRILSENIPFTIESRQGEG